MKNVSFCTLMALCLVLITAYSCSIKKKQICRTEIKRLKHLEYVLSDTSVCYLPELKIKNERIVELLDSILNKFNSCKHCVTNTPIPKYFKIGGKQSLHDSQLYIMQSYWTEEIPEYINFYLGGFYYKETLFIVYNNIKDVDNLLFEKTDCVIRIEKCNLRIIGSCFNATISLKNERVIDYNCNDPLPFLR